MSNNTAAKANGPFLTFSVGTATNKKGESFPYVFQMEGFLGHDPQYLTANGDKSSMLSMPVAVGRNPWLMLGDEAVTAQAQNEHTNAERRFVSVILNGALADEYKDKLLKGARVVFCGRPKQSNYKAKDDTERFGVTVYADSLYQVSSRVGAGDDARSFITQATNTYTRKDNTVAKQNVATLLVGVVKEVSGVETTSAGQAVLNFNLELTEPATKVEAIVNGNYSKDVNYGSYRIVKCAIWGKRAQTISKALTIGNTIAISASMSAHESNNGKMYVNATVRDLSVLKWATAYNGSAAAQPAAPGSAVPPTPVEASETEPTADFGTLMDGDDFELPF